MPLGYKVIMTAVGGPKIKEDFGLDIMPGRTVIGALKLAWEPDTLLDRVPGFFL